MKTINQLLDKINDLTLDQMTPKLGLIRQNLIDLKKKGGHKGGLAFVTNSQYVLNLIAEAKRQKIINQKNITEKAILL